MAYGGRPTSSHYELKAVLIALQAWDIIVTDSATAQSDLPRFTLKDSSESKDLNFFTSPPEPRTSCTRTSDANPWPANENVLAKSHSGPEARPLKELSSLIHFSLLPLCTPFCPRGQMPPHGRLPKRMAPPHHYGRPTSKTGKSKVPSNFISPISSQHTADGPPPRHACAGAGFHKTQNGEEVR